ncbi:HTH-type transcriptional repressor PurR [alpha proteobacterium Q-1]|nr:HTH-type transcriptional repressor PurR [alpha proteobacterium Q-1]
MTSLKNLSRSDNLNMADIARLAGVSESTVSRALADSPLVNAKTKDRIRKIARQNHYVVNEQARNFRLKRTGTIAVVIPIDAIQQQPISDPFFMELLGAIADALNARGFDLLLSRADATNPKWSAMALDNGRADGTIIIGQSTQHQTLNKMADSGAPMVVWGGRLPDQRYTTVGCDNLAGGMMATRHLIDQGRRHIAFMGHRDWPEVDLRYQGYLAALDAAGLEADPQLVLDSRFTREDAHRVIADMTRSGLAPDGIVAASDVLAMAAIKTLQEQGISVPRDLSIIGFDDIALATWYNPPITTIRQHIVQGGRFLVDLMMAKIAGEATAPVMLTPELVIRGSCGAKP